MSFIKFAFGLSLSLGLALSSVPAFSESPVRFRAGFTLGTWTGIFTQSGYGQSSDTHQGMMVAGDLGLGLIIKDLVFIEHTGAYFPYYSNNAKKASYSSYLGVRAGVYLPSLPIGVYLGIEKSKYAFKDPGAFDGGALKLGSYFNFAKLTPFDLGVRAEYRYVSLTSDRAGDIPSSYSTHASVLFVGICMQL